MLFKKTIICLEVKCQGPTKVITVRDTPPYGHAPTYQISLTYLERQNSYGPVVYGYGQISIWGGSRGIGPLCMLDQKWRHRKTRDFSPYFFFHVLFFPYFFFPYFFSRTFFSRTFFPFLFPRTCFPPYYFPVVFFPYFFPVPFSRIFSSRTFSPVLFFSRTFSKVATFEIQRFKLSVGCFSSTCRYSTVHVPCGIAIQTSPVGLPLDGWGARMRVWRDKNIYLFNLKEDWNVL